MTQYKEGGELKQFLHFQHLHSADADADAVCTTRPLSGSHPTPQH